MNNGGNTATAREGVSEKKPTGGAQENIAENIAENMVGTLTGTIAGNLAEVTGRIEAAARRSGRDPAEVTLIAVSKTKSAAAVMEAYRAGQRVFGENRVQEARQKMEETGPGPLWHLIGHLQGNKAKLVPGRFAAVHSVDSERIALALEAHAGRSGVNLEVFLQLNWQGEDTKAGVNDATQLSKLTESVAGCSHLVLRGLMTIPRSGMNEASTRRLYAKIRSLHAGIKSEFGLGGAFDQLSFGMSHDFEWAVEEGATMVRVGTAIFGARQ